MKFIRVIKTRSTSAGWSAMLRRLFLSLTLFPFAALGLPYLPMNGVVIDTSTGTPVEGVFVITYWNIHGADLVGSRTSCEKVIVTVSDAKGRFHFGGGFAWGDARYFYAYKAGYEIDYQAWQSDDRVTIGPFRGTDKERVEMLKSATRFGWRSCGSTQDMIMQLGPLYRAIDLEFGQLAARGQETGRPWGLTRNLQHYLTYDPTLKGLSTTRFFESRKELEEWMGSYYLHPEPSRLGPAVTAIDEYDAIRSSSYQSATYVGFVAGALMRSPESADRLLQHLAGLRPTCQAILGRGLWYSRIPASAAYLERIGASMRLGERGFENPNEFGPPPSGPARNLLEIPIDEGWWVANALWGMFLATGDDAPILRMISVLRPPSEHDLTSREQRLAHEMAARLAGYAYEHPSVLEILRVQQRLQPPPIAKVLGYVIAQAEGSVKARDQASRASSAQ